ncbi:Piwi-like protein ergo-1 [Frankliniella fusca]|uniref:Piwi-like protein ergo-1 n=1 Tax=Frankliniella fusca TaxID=407009 RepID=A0AAE1GSD8_9NEOP|nr:Piwi-like protein ergo-1 [Frankliniella fusca]
MPPPEVRWTNYTFNEDGSVTAQTVRIHNPLPPEPRGFVVEVAETPLAAFEPTCRRIPLPPDAPAELPRDLRLLLTGRRVAAATSPDPSHQQPAAPGTRSREMGNITQSHDLSDLLGSIENDIGEFNFFVSTAVARAVHQIGDTTAAARIQPPRRTADLRCPLLRQLVELLPGAAHPRLTA